jgi:hypothetical protein
MSGPQGKDRPPVSKAVDQGTLSRGVPARQLATQNRTPRASGRTARRFEFFDPRPCHNQKSVSYWGGGSLRSLTPLQCHTPTLAALLYDSSSGTMRGIRLLDSSRRFRQEATAWEKTNCFPMRNKTRPLVDKTGAVLGHVLKVPGSDLYVPKGFQGSWLETLQGDVPLYRASRRKIGPNLSQKIPPALIWRQLGHDHEGFSVLFNIEGTPLAVLQHHTERGVINQGLGPIDFIGLAHAVVKLAALLSRKLAVRVYRKGVKSIADKLEPPGAPLARTVPLPERMTLAVREMADYLRRVWKKNPEFAALRQAGKELKGEPLRKRILKILHGWENRRGMRVKFVDRVRTADRPGNFARIRGRDLEMEKQLLDKPEQLLEEAVHELAYDALHARRMGPNLNGLFSGVKILDDMVKVGPDKILKQLISALGP